MDQLRVPSIMVGNLIYFFKSQALIAIRLRTVLSDILDLVHASFIQFKLFIPKVAAAA